MNYGVGNRLMGWLNMFAYTFDKQLDLHVSLTWTKFYKKLCFIQDRSDVVAYHTQQSIEFIEKVSKFTKERARIEQDYAKELR